MRRKRIPGTWLFFHGVTYSHFWCWKLCLGSVENTRGIYFCVAEHPVPFGGGRSSPWSPFLTLCSCKLELPVLFLWTSCAIFPAVSSVKIPKLDNGWKWQRQSRESLLTRAGPSSELPFLKWNSTKTWGCTVKFVLLSREKPLRVILTLLIFGLWGYFCGRTVWRGGENGKNSQNSPYH